MEIRLITVLVILFCINLTFGFKYKICALKRYESICQQLERDDNIKCEYVENEASCLTKIDSGEIDFATVSAETGFLGAGLTTNVTPIALTNPETENLFDYETVIVTKEKPSSETLEGMSYCHPGFHNTKTPPLILKEFEQHIFRNQIEKICENINDEMTTIEFEIMMLNKYFGPSCRPGDWSVDKNFSEVLRTKYPKLTQLCPNLNGDFFEKSLQCMLNTSNSIALTSLNTIKDKNISSLYYYCKNGTFSNEPCIWSKQPHQFLVINQNKKDSLYKEMMDWFSMQSEPHNKQGSNDDSLRLSNNEIDYINRILNIVTDTVNMRISFLNDSSKSFSDFIKELRHIPNQEESMLCGRQMKWCTTSEEEQRKCKWLSQASINYGIQPVVNCEQKSGQLSCLRGVNKDMKTVDLLAISANLGYAAKRNGLSAIAFPETMKNQEIKTILLVKGENITRLENLKGKKGCFPLYSGIAWLSFIETTRGKILPDESCDYGKLISESLGDSCMPGAMESNRALNNNVDTTKMCQLCIDSGKTCDANEATNWYFNDIGALKCLEERGDFAVVVKNDSFPFPNNVQVMCKNGTLSTTDAWNVDENCYLAELTTSEIVTRRDDPLNKDIQLALLEYDSWFASQTHTPFRLFDSFNGRKDLLFKDSTPGLDLPTSDKKAIKNYVNLFHHIDDCSTGTANNPQNGKASIAFITTFLLIVPFMNIFV